MGVLWHNWPKLISALQPETPTGSTFLPFLTVSSWSGLCVCTTVVLWSVQRLLLIVFLMLCNAVMPKAYLLSAVLVHARGGIFSVMWWCSQLRPFYLHMTKILERKKTWLGTRIQTSLWHQKHRKLRSQSTLSLRLSQWLWYNQTI